MGDVRVTSTADSLCGSQAGQHNFQLFVVTVQSHPSVLNIRRSLSAPKPQVHRINDRGSYRPVDWASTCYLLSTECQIQVLSDSEMVPHHAQTTCVDADQEAYLSRDLVNH